MSSDVKLMCLLLTVAAEVALLVDGRLDVNVALQRPSYQTNIYTSHRGPHSPDLANDGNRASTLDMIGNSCMSTNPTTNPWYAVDLGVPLYVAGVMFTNRGDGWPYRSNNFIVGLTDVSPVVTAPTLWNYDVCGQYPGTVGSGATVYLPCKCGVLAYRYVVVQFPITEWSNFCELEVYIRRWDWVAHVGQKMIGKEAETFQVDRRIRCMILCIKSPVCDSYNYRASDKTCQFNTHDTSF